MQVKSYFPRTVDRPLIVLFWELDEFIFFLIPLVFSLPMRQLIAGMAAGLACVWLYSKFKKGAPDNFLAHWLWKFGLTKIKGSPEPHIQEFLE